MEMQTNMKALIFCVLFITATMTAQYIFYGDELTYIMTEPPKKANVDMPVISQVLDFFQWVYAGLQVLWNMLTFNIPELPLYIRVFFIIPLWTALLYILVPLLIRLIEAIGNWIPFT